MKYKGLKLVLPRIDKSIFEEIIVIDAQSTDGTVEYIKKFNDIKLVTQLSKGLTAAMVEAIENRKDSNTLLSLVLIIIAILKNFR